jgi:hypothetical protein
MRKEICMRAYIVAPTLLFRSEVYATGAAKKRRIEVMEMKWMRAMRGVSIMVRTKLEMKMYANVVAVFFGKRKDINVLRWYGHVERIEEKRKVKRVYNAKVVSSRTKGRPKM